MDQQTIFPGYTMLDNGNLQPSFDEHGTMLNSNVVITPNVLCKRCEEIVGRALAWIEDGVDPGTLPFHPSVSTFQQSVEDGCHLCAHFWAVSVIFYKQNGTPEEKVSCLSLLSPSSVVVTRRPAELRLLRSDGSTTTPLFFTFGRPFDPGPVENPAFKAKMSASNTSEPTWDIARAWLDRCIQHHTDCYDIQKSVVRPPTRLVDIGDLPNSQLRLIRPDAHVPWVAVSHCWGKHDKTILKLTTSNLDQLIAGFSSSDLPDLFRDCITVARELQCRYLWIDTVCIIQDSAEDWRVEAERMGDVYRGAYFTIAAVSAPGSRTSLFTKSHPLIRQKYSFSRVDKSGTKNTSITPTLYFTDPLYSRAWVLQERLLAPRTLEYTNGGIKWRCAETGLLDLDDEIHGSQSFGLSKTWENLLNLRADNLSRVERRIGQQYWTRILLEYNISDLTYETDRPFAIRGIVKTLEKQTGISVTAGIVHEFLPHALLWQKPDKRGFPYKQDNDYYTYEAWKASIADSPSWSCAYRHRYIDVTGTELYGFPQAETTIISGAQPRLSIQGQSLCQVSIKFTPRANRISICSDNTYWSVQLQQLRSRWISVGDFLPCFGLILSLDFVLEREIECNLVLISILQEKISEESLMRICAHGLVLANFEPESGDWERIGVFSMPGPAYEAGRLLLELEDEKSEFIVR